VLYGDVAIPPFAAARRWVDFRNAVGDVFDEKITGLADAIRGQTTKQQPGPRATRLMNGRLAYSSRLQAWFP
jgi:hypothetical protein